MYLVDTNVISELRSNRIRPADPRVKCWAASVPADSLFLSVVTVLELNVGTLLLARKDKAQAAVLRSWIEERILPSFQQRILLVDEAIATRCAGLHVPNRMPELDALIAATALVHRMTLVTRNSADFEGIGLQVLNPWEFQLSRQ